MDIRPDTHHPGSETSFNPGGNRLAPHQFTAVILAGGQSRRMGRDKAWLLCEGKPLLQRALETVRAAGAHEIFISARPDQDFSALPDPCPVLVDLQPGFGPMGGIERALFQATASLVLVLAVDLPRMTPSFLCQLVGRCDAMTGAIPILKGELEPLVAIYPKQCHPLAARALSQQQPRVRDFAETCLRAHALRSFPVAPQDAPQFANWNAPADAHQSNNL